jgi:hypothetical protein
MQCKKLLKQKSTNDHKWNLHFDALPTTPIGWFWLFFKVGTYMFSYYYNTPYHAFYDYQNCILLLLCNILFYDDKLYVVHMKKCI